MKRIQFGPFNKVLEVDLSSEIYSTYIIDDKERALYLGGKGLGLKLIYDRLEPGTDPLGKDNIFAIMPGVLMGTGAICSGRFAAVTKSPLTGIMVSSSCGGPFGMALKTAGWDGLLVKGKAKQPAYIKINNEGVVFHNAKDLWGCNIDEGQEKLDTKKSASLIIGPAGENLVSFANIASGSRFLGRGGMGAVMGAKNLKAIVAVGGYYRIKPKNKPLFDKIKKKSMAYINRNPMAIANRDYGTNANVNPVNKAGMLPVNNFSKGSHRSAPHISGEKIKEKHNTKYHTCKPCAIMCGHKGTFKNKETSVPEFETIGLLGANLGIFDSDLISEWNDICSKLGMDTISAGGTLGWVMEAGEKGLVKTPLMFESPHGISEALKAMAFRKGFGDEMAMGSRFLAEKYGGKSFAIHVKGLEMAAYDPRGAFGQGLAYAVANRGACHLSAYLVAMEVYFKLLKTDTTLAKPEFVQFFENLTCCINSLQTCQFTMYAYTLEPPLSKYTPDLILGLLMQYLPALAVRLVDFSLYTKTWTAVTGISISNSEFLKAGERVHVLERYMNTREGISKKDDTLPARMLNEGRGCDAEGRTVPLDKMLNKYYKIRGFNQNGIPTKETLGKLKIPPAIVSGVWMTPGMRL